MLVLVLKLPDAVLEVVDEVNGLLQNSRLLELRREYWMENILKIAQG